MRAGAPTDRWLLASILTLLVFGLVMVWSATQYVPPPKPRAAQKAATAGRLTPAGDPAAQEEEGKNRKQEPVSAGDGRIFKQALGALLGVGLMIAFKRMDYRRLNSPLWALGWTGLGLALVALAYGVDRDHHRFLKWGWVGVHPAELAKPALAIFLAYFVAERAKALNDSRTLAPAAMTVGLMTGAVMVADLGTAAVMAATAAVVFLVAGLEWRHFRTAGAVTAVFVVVAIVAQPYRLARVIAFLDPQMKIVTRLGCRPWVEQYLAKSQTVRDPGYQTRQSLIALGSGGLLGLGPLKGEHKLGYLPLAYNDFIYAVVGEELGLAGCTVVLLLFLIILWRGLRLARSALDDFGRYLALGVTTLVVLQAFLNMSVVLGLLPTKGITLPMISSGVSSLVSTLILFGMLLSIADRSA
jgi:cell division protein FtsW